MPAIRTSPRTSYVRPLPVRSLTVLRTNHTLCTRQLPTYSELAREHAATPWMVTFEPGCAAFSLRAPAKMHPQAGAHIRDCPPEMRFVESDPDWEYVGHARGIRDIELYRHVPVRGAQVFVFSRSTETDRRS